MARLSLAAAVLLLLVVLLAGGAAAARPLRHGPHGAVQPALPRLREDARGALRSLLKDKAADGGAADLQGGLNRPWPTTRPIATSSGRGAPPVAASSRAYGYTSNASPIVMNTGMNEPVSEGMWNQRG
jgi:hypothetical protein